MAIQYRDYITSSYTIFNRIRDHYPSTLSSDITLESGCFNKINLKVDISRNKSIIEIPCIVRGTIISILNTIRINTSNPTETILIPMFRNRSSYSYRTNIKEVKSANPLLKYLFMETPGMDILNWCKCGDTVYYGGSGILFYEDMTPMIMFSLELERFEDKFIPLRPIIRIHPDIYTNEDLMSKHIRTKMLCNIMEMNSNFCRIYLGDDIITESYIDSNFKVIIDDFTKEWFEYPTVPDISVTSENINDFLAKNFTEYDF